MKKPHIFFNDRLFMRVVLSFILIQFNITFLSAQNLTDSIVTTVNVKDILIESTRSKGLSGIKVNIIFENLLEADDSLHVNYNLNGKLYTRKFSKLKSKSVDKIAIFHPFAILYQTSGIHKATLKLKSIIDISKENTYKIEGQKIQIATVDVPSIHTVKIKVTYTEVSEKTPKGKAWDYSFFARDKTDKYPDLIYTIQAPFNEDSLGVFNGQFYRAHMQKNTLIAGWPYFSDTILYCEGDELSICLKDIDLMFHDTIGCISIKKLKSLSKTEQLLFGSVVNFSCEIITK